VIPLALLAREELALPGWTPNYHPQPDWWFETQARPAGPGGPASASSPPKAGKAPKPAQPAAAAMFEVAQVSPDAWIDRVLASEIMTQRLSRQARGAMPAARLAILLRLLDERGGAATRTAVARALDVPEARVASQIAAAQRVVNIDGYDVLDIEGDTVRLNADLLKTQTDTR